VTTIQPDPLREAYVLRVGAALGDVDSTERHALLADLRLHLDEVAHGDPRSLDDIVGPPEVYAAELRAAAGLAPDPTVVVPAPTPAPPSGSAGAGHAWPWLRQQVGRAWAVVRDGWEDVRAALAEALGNGPTWWLLRAFLATQAVGLLTGSDEWLLWPQVGDGPLWGPVVLFAAAVVSVRVGRDPERLPLRVVRVANVAIVVLGVAALA
jgi:hypothetical protein